MEFESNDNHDDNQKSSALALSGTKVVAYVTLKIRLLRATKLTVGYEVRIMT